MRRNNDRGRPFEDFGLDPDKIEEASADEHAVGFVEIHIEQGPVLEAEGSQRSRGHKHRWPDPAAISGSSAMPTMPAPLRCICAAMRWPLPPNGSRAVEALAMKTDGLVATVGKLDAHPNAGNVIAGSAELSLDVRHPDDTVAGLRSKNLIETAEAIATRRGLQARMDRQRWTSRLCRWTSASPRS